MKSDPGEIRIEDYLYDLPPDRIAKYPLPERDSSKLLVYEGGKISDSVFTALPSLLDTDTLLVFNNTRVIRARLLFTKESGATVEIFCLEPLNPSDFVMNLSAGPGIEWKCLIGNLKRWKRGTLTALFNHDGINHQLHAERVSTEGDAFRIRFNWDDRTISFSDILETLGHVPIPPYLGRGDEESDKARYQTTYARIKGSVAAPTAGLHFTSAVFAGIEKQGIEKAEVTLHVSAGTFRPVKSEKISGHQMHTEHFFVTAETIRKLIGRNIVAIGTTTVRTLESMYWLGVALGNGYEPGSGTPCVSQWDPYNHDYQVDTSIALNNLITWMDHTGKSSIEAKTDIIIVPGYRFRVVNSMVTNFHQPGSTLLLLVAAFTGESWKKIYDHALSSDYRFLSYGDSMLLKSEGCK